MEPGWPVGDDASRDGSRKARRFDSWKEIAAYFGRDVRTVRRWERDEGLPVHRHLHRARGSVYGIQDELDLWQARRTAATAVPGGSGQAGKRFLLIPVVLTPLVLAGSLVLTYRPTSPAPPETRNVTAKEAAEIRAVRWLSDPELRQRFLLARHHLDRRAGFRREAREYLEAVVKGAPAFAEAHALLAEAYLREALADRPNRGEAWRKAHASARQALALDDHLSTAHAVLSRILLIRDWNWTAASAESLRAIELDPDAPLARSARALYLRAGGRMEEAIVERERAHHADPLNPQWLVFLGDEYLFARRYLDALHIYERALELERDYRPAVASLGDVYARIGRPADAAVWLLRTLTLRGQQDLAAAFDAVRQREGPSAAILWLDRWNLREFQRAPNEHLWDLAYTHARLGHRDAALEFLHDAYEQREPGVLQARVDPDLDSLQGDPRFDDLLRRMGPHLP